MSQQLSLRCLVEKIYNYLDECQRILSQGSIDSTTNSCVIVCETTTFHCSRRYCEGLVRIKYGFLHITEMSVLWYLFTIKMSILSYRYTRIADSSVVEQKKCRLLVQVHKKFRFFTSAAPKKQALGNSTH